MRPLVSLFSLFSLFRLFSLKSTETSTPGICSVPHIVQNHRYSLDRSNKEWTYEAYNDTVWRDECCEGYRRVSVMPLSCDPICDPPCENSDCMLPDTCVCHTGHVMINNSSNTCYEVCDSCINGKCLHPEDTECTCNFGYQRDPRFPHICDPICNPKCFNAYCHSPDECICHEGYEPSIGVNFKHRCSPHCEEECEFGVCKKPNVCECYPGYINDKVSPSICLPVCNTTCENGDCYAPDMCKCRPGYTLHTANPYVCIPEDPEDSSFAGKSLVLNHCQLTMPRGVKYDNNSDCFLIKEKVSINVPSNCSILETQSGTFCSQSEFCHQSECVLNFRCHAEKFNGVNEIHCYLEEDDFETDTAYINQITNATDWTDITLVVNSYRNFNSSGEVKMDTIKEWTLKPLSKGPICGKMQFAVELNECEQPLKTTQGTNHINSSFKFWMNVVLVCGFLLIFGAGVGGFFWARHRRLTDPLNYREDMIQRSYSNHIYNNQVEDLVSDDDDDSDHYSEAPL